MPISYKHKIVFIHIPKTGGTSITNGLGIEQLKENLHGTEYSHFTSNEIKEAYPKIWKKFFKFTIIRNPFDRLVSEWAYQGKRKPFKEFALSLYMTTATHYVPQYKFINDDEITVFRFEEFSKIIDFLEKKTGCHIPHGNKSKHDPYQTYYDDETRKCIEKTYKEDLEQLEYKF